MVWLDFYGLGNKDRAGGCDGAHSAAERSYPTSEVRGRSQEDPMPEGLRPRGIGGRRRRGRQRMRWLDGITDGMDLSLSEPGSW